MKKYTSTSKSLLFILACFFLLSGCGMTHVYDLKPPRLVENPGNAYPFAVAFIVDKANFEHRTEMADNNVHVYHALPDFYMQTLMARFDEVEIFQDIQEVSADDYDLIARMAVDSGWRKLNWAQSQAYVTLTLTLERMDGTPVVSQAMDAAGGWAAKQHNGIDPDPARASQAFAETFAAFGTVLDNSQALMDMMYE